ncbi:hypothetical protein B0H65DRAFT_283299 [Neurospora tetraspora]|uniref:Uncharacterized protein n=1 Tax=Neurospora tetraspora TaxID=94610 RepID=A0AAE0MNM4_9PEZI|nr:hypothetical protein B0H65DRAFT_283299 [Neurospora tetraspora]
MSNSQRHNHHNNHNNSPPNSRPVHQGLIPTRGFRRQPKRNPLSILPPPSRKLKARNFWPLHQGSVSGQPLRAGLGTATAVTPVHQAPMPVSVFRHHQSTLSPCSSVQDISHIFQSVPTSP